MRALATKQLEGLDFKQTLSVNPLLHCHLFAHLYIL